MFEFSNVTFFSQWLLLFVFFDLSFIFALSQACSVSTIISLIFIWFWVLVGLDFCPFQVDSSPPPFGKGAMAYSSLALVHSFSIYSLCVHWSVHVYELLPTNLCTHALTPSLR